MKNVWKSLLFALVASAAVYSCSKEVDSPIDEQPISETITNVVKFKAEIADPSTKATLEANAKDTQFLAAWEDASDKIDLTAISDSFVDEAPAQWDATEECFVASFTSKTPTVDENWDYEAVYPYVDGGNIPFGSARTQKGNAYNSAFDVMYGTQSYSGTRLGKDEEGENFVIPMDRLTGIAYFHITGGPDEDVVSATLSVQSGNIAASSVSVSSGTMTPSEATNSITITFPEEAPKATDIQLWFNVIPGSYTGLKLTIETTNKVSYLQSKATMNYTAGKINKVVLGDLAWLEPAKYEKVTSTAGVTEGQYLIVYEAGNLAFKGSLSTLDAVGNYVSVSISDGKITPNDVTEANYVTLASYDGGFSIKAAGGHYMGRTATGNGFDEGSTELKHTIEISDGNAIITSSGGPKLQFYSTSGSERFRYYASTQKAVQLYKLSDGRSTASGISFANASYTFELGDDDYNAFGGQTASLPDGNQAVITYSMSGDDIGIIDSATGEILLDDETTGTATITASATASGNYRAGSTTYTITVTPKVSTLSDVTTESSYYLRNITVMAVEGNNAILHDATGNKLLYKSSHGLTAGKFFNSVTATTTTYDARDILQITAFSDAVYGDNVAVNHGVAAELTSSMFDSEVRYIHAVGTKAGRNISVTSAGTLYLTSASEVEDGPVEIYGYTVGYHTTNEVLYIIATDLQVYVDPDEPALLLNGASSNVALDWEFDATDAKAVEITVNANGSYTKTETTMDWATVTLVDGTLTVTPKSTNGNVAPNSGTITITHNADGSLSRTITCTQGGYEDLVTATATFTYNANGGMTTTAGAQSGTRRNVTAEISNGVLNASAEAIAVYKNATLVISVPSGAKITNIELTGISGNAVSNFSEIDGLTTDGNDGTWSGNAQSVTFTASGAQVRLASIEVAYKIATASLAYYTPTIVASDMNIGISDDPVTIEATSDSPGVISYSIVSGDSYISLNTSTGVVTPIAVGKAVVRISVEAYGDYSTGSKDINIDVKDDSSDPVAVYSATFEGSSEHRTSGSNSYTTNEYTVSGVSWSLSKADCVTSGSPINGSANIMCRVKGNSNNGYATTGDVLKGTSTSLSKLTYASKLGTNVTVTVKYSTDNSSWSTVDSYKNTTKADREVDLTSIGTTSHLYLKFEYVTSDGSTTTSNRDSQLDDVIVYGVQ